MSWGIQTPCWNCAKSQDCNDAKHVQDGINAAHLDMDGHKGSGMVVMSCAKCSARN